MLEPKRAILVEIAADGFGMDWFCFVSVEATGGVVLGVDLLQRLAALAVTMTSMTSMTSIIFGSPDAMLAAAARGWR